MSARALPRETPGWGAILAAEAAGGAGWPLVFGASPEQVARHSGGHLIYLATPFTRVVVDADGNYSEIGGYEAALRAALVLRRLALAGVTAVSPVMLAVRMCAPDVALLGRAPDRLDPLDEVFWARWCCPLLAACRVLYVPAIGGWSASHGIWREVIWALDHGVPVFVEAQGAE